MITHKYAHQTSLPPERVGGFGMWIGSAVLGLAMLVCASARATVTPYVLDDAAVKQYALLAKGSFYVNNTTVNGDTGVISGQINAANNDNLKGDLVYQNGPFSLNSTISVSGEKRQDLTLSNTVSDASAFSMSMANFKATQTLAGNLNNVTLTSTGDLNVINLRGNNVNGTVTLSGDANDIFYINVWSNMNVSGIVLADGVLASNVYWNLLSSQNSNLSGNLNGTFLAFNSGGTATKLNINNAQVTGNVIGGEMHISNTVITGISVQTAVPVVPETSSVVAMSLLALFVLGSSFVRNWQQRRRRAVPVLGAPQAA